MKGDPIGDALRRGRRKAGRTGSLPDAISGKGGMFDEEVYSEIRAAAARWGEHMSDLAQAAVMVPAGLWSFSSFMGFPDLDISTLGIGNHRFFVFHSAAAPWLLGKLYEARLARTAGSTKITDKVVDRLLGVMAASGAWAVGVHLALDVVQPKSVVFPVFGSLLDGTLVDDEIWLLGNALYCFHLGNRMFALALGEDLPRVKAFVRRNIADPLKEVARDAVPGWS